MLLNDIAPVKTGNAFIINADEISNYNGNESVNQNFLDGFPKQSAWKQVANEYRSRHVFTDCIEEFDYDIPQSEYKLVAGKYLKKFYDELANITKTQPLYIRAFLSATVVAVIPTSVEICLPCNAALITDVGGANALVPYGGPLELGNKLGIGKAYINHMWLKSSAINGKYKIAPAIEIIIRTYDYTA